MGSSKILRTSEQYIRQPSTLQLPNEVGPRISTGAHKDSTYRDDKKHQLPVYRTFFGGFLSYNSIFELVFLGAHRKQLQGRQGAFSHKLWHRESLCRCRKNLAKVRSGTVGGSNVNSHSFCRNRCNLTLEDFGSSLICIVKKHLYKLFSYIHVSSLYITIFIYYIYIYK